MNTEQNKVKKKTNRIWFLSVSKFRKTFCSIQINERWCTYGNKYWRLNWILSIPFALTIKTPEGQESLENSIEAKLPQQKWDIKRSSYYHFQKLNGWDRSQSIVPGTYNCTLELCFRNYVDKQKLLWYGEKSTFPLWNWISWRKKKRWS